MEDQRETLEEGALAVFRVVEPVVPLQVDQLRTLPNVICAAVTLGVRRGAAAALVSVHLRSGIHLGGLEPGFPATASATTHRATMLNFAGFGRVIAAEMDVEDTMQCGVDSALDGP